MSVLLESGILEIILENLKSSNLLIVEAAIEAFLQAITVNGFKSRPDILVYILQTLISFSNVVVANKGIITTIRSNNNCDDDEDEGDGDDEIIMDEEY